MATKMRTEQLEDGMLLARDIYINSNVLFQEGTYITPEITTTLIHFGVRETMVHQERATSFHTRHASLTDHELQILSDRFKTDVRSVANELRCGRILHSEASYLWLRSVYIRFFSNPTVALLMNSLKQWDPACYIHSIDVFVLCSLYSRHAKWKAPDDFMLGCLLHDIGKLYTPRAILLKSQKLTQREFERVKEHCARGAGLLRKLGFPDETCRIARSHHERMNRTGYPEKKAISDADQDLKLMMITDIYSALTLKRSYRQPLPATRALQLILSSCIQPPLFDLKSCFSFINFIHIFPPATQVLLTDGRTGTVLSSEEGSVILPRIFMKDSSLVRQLPRDLSVTIKKVIGWDNSQMERQRKEAWNGFVTCLIDGNTFQAMELLDTLSDGLRIEEIFIKLFERSMNQIESGLAQHRYETADRLIAASTLVMLLNWKMISFIREQRQPIGKTVVANLGSIGEFTQMKLLDDLFQINGWKTYYLAENADAAVIAEIVRRKKPDFLAISCPAPEKLFTISNTLKQLRSEFPELILFVHGKKTHRLSGQPSERTLISTNIQDFTENLRSVFRVKSAANARQQ
ncbi:HD domain-containing phosphohydrolase [Sporolactobacillus vineae]|uniref:HD domain-containing phosphohydrolase n=1 Tax=Sporolactobacillus vineae TaxID=444463 RepID=UPI000288265E|nr:HD domain-containing phosphohydrolase [Sporolactobacillus vineae]